VKDNGSDIMAVRFPLKPVKKIWKKKVVMEDINLGKKPGRLIWLEALTEAFLEYL